MSEITSANKEIQPGDIFYMNKKYKYWRVLLCDEYKVFYQNHILRNPESDLASVKSTYSSGKQYFTFTSLQHFRDENFPFVGRKELSDEERNWLRPELPLFFGRSKLLSWKTISKFSDYRALFDYDQEFKKQLSFDTLFIETYGPRGGGKKVAQIKSSESGQLTVAEVVWQSARFQMAAFEDDRYGVGIYRLGIHKGYPLFYLFGNYDRGGSFRSKELGRGISSVVTLNGIELDSLGWKEFLKKKSLNKTSFRVTIDEKKFPVKGTELQLFLKWHSEPVMRFRIPSSEFDLDLSEFPPGPYIIFLKNEEEDVFTGWHHFHLIRDDFDDWVYIYPDMDNITKYSKKVEEPKKLSIPKIRANASMEKYEKKFRELFADERNPYRGEIMDMEGHEFSLHYFDLNEEDSHYDVLSEKGFQGGGPTWHGIVSGAIELTDPTLNGEIYIDEDSEGIIVSSENKKVLEKIGRLIAILKSNPDLLAAAIHVAEKKQMID